MKPDEKNTVASRVEEASAIVQRSIKADEKCYGSLSKEFMGFSLRVAIVYFLNFAAMLNAYTFECTTLRKKKLCSRKNLFF